MTKSNILKRLRKEGYKVTLDRYAYWDNIGYVKTEKSIVAIAEIWGKGNNHGINETFKYDDVISTIRNADNRIKFNEFNNNCTNWNSCIDEDLDGFAMASVGDYLEIFQNN